MTRPNFFIIGAPKCGTTSIVDWLSQHPNVFTCKPKEPHFFNTDDSFRFVNSEIEYLDLFSSAAEKQTSVGEASTWYLFSKTAVSNIELFTGNSARYIVCLRNPSEMAPSLHGQNLFSGNEVIKNFEEAWAAQKQRALGKGIPRFCKTASHLKYTEACSLGAQVERLLKQVPRDRVLFVLLEDLAKDPEAQFNKILTFLDLGELDTIDFSAKNMAHRPRSYLLTRLISMAGVTRRKLGIKFSFGVLTFLRNSNKRTFKRPQVSAALKDEMKSTFRNDINKLEQLIEKNLSHWKS